MHLFRISVVVSGLALSACGGSGHAVCKDQTSAAAYGRQWGMDLAAAVRGGKVPKDKADAAAKALTAEVPNIAPNDFAAVCNKMDELRKEAGF